MRYAVFEQLETVHLVLRKFRYDDADDFYVRVGGNPRVAKYMLWEPHKSVEESQKSIEKILSRYEEGICYTWAIALHTDDSVIGRIDLLRIDEKENSCSFAYMIGDEFWGRGFGTEALSAVLKYAFEKMEMQMVSADHMSENEASGAVMRKAGMCYKKTYLSKYEKNKRVYDADEYCITYEEWKHFCVVGEKR